MYEKNALNNFKDVLGKYCAINQFVELSKRCFLVEHQNEIQKRDTFVKLATEYAVTLTNYDADSMVCEICRSYIVNVHLCFETFLKDVCRQINTERMNINREFKKSHIYYVQSEIFVVITYLMI